MLSKQVIPIVGFCAISLLSSSAVAHQDEWRVINSATNMCLEATAETGKAILSECKLARSAEGDQALEWLVNAPMPDAIKNFEFSSCLAMDNDGTIHTNVYTAPCEDILAQKWEFTTLNNNVGPIKNKGNEKCLKAVRKQETLALVGARCDNADRFQRWYWMKKTSKKGGCFCPCSE